MELINRIKLNAKKHNKRIVLPEGTEDRTIQAADIAIEEGLAQIILIGNPSEINALALKKGLKNISKAKIVDPKTHEKKERYIELMLEIRKSKGLTREDHREVSDCLYYAYAEGRRVRELIAVIGEEALSEMDRLYLHFADEFERRFINQGYYEDRSFEKTLDLGWELLSMLPESELKRADPTTIRKYLPKYRKKEVITEPSLSA